MQRLFLNTNRHCKFLLNFSDRGPEIHIVYILTKFVVVFVLGIDQGLGTIRNLIHHNFLRKKIRLNQLSTSPINRFIEVGSRFCKRVTVYHMQFCYVYDARSLNLNFSICIRTWDHRNAARRFGDGKVIL
jgi:hypothetical protein